MPLVTRVEPAGRGGTRVRVDLDGAAWTTVPRRWAARRRLEPGRELPDHERTAIEDDLVERVGRFLCLAALGQGPRSAVELRRRLERYGLAPAVVDRTLVVIGRTTLVDDGQLAGAVASSLRRRGYGDARIRQTLARRGLSAAAPAVPPEPLDDAVSRARTALGARHRGDPARATVWLARRGFALEACHRAVRGRDEEDDQAAPSEAPGNARDQ
jgi:SOS response regulatory protein OraA/RecX